MDVPLIDVSAPGQSDSASTWARTVLWWIVYPVGFVLWYLVLAVIFVLKLLYQPVGFLLLPFVYVGRFLWACAMLPFRLIAKLETLYIYLGVAAIVGLTGGLIVGAVYLWFYKILRLERKQAPLPGRTAKQYREERRRQKISVEMPINSPDHYSSGHLSPGPLSPGYMSLSDGTRVGKRARGLLASTILEEQDSDF